MKLATTRSATSSVLATSSNALVLGSFLLLVSVLVSGFLKQTNQTEELISPFPALCPASDDVGAAEDADEPITTLMLR